MVKMKNKFRQQSINDYLGLRHRAWFVEFEIGDFGASIANLFELPQEIFETRAKIFFWDFLKVFLLKSEIGFILRHPKPNDSNFDTVDLALIGCWDNRQFAIPLWIIKDLLLGFEIIPAENFTVLDSEPLNWSQMILADCNKNNSSSNEKPDLFILNDDFFQGQKIYFKLEGGRIVVSKYFNELDFFDRIAKTIIPEIDEFEFEDQS
ncbi:MAG: hypothetical protein ACXADY_00980 [Candidatus Hodarchaeales archaeon]|jgi:hypothetical protein